MLTAARFRQLALALPGSSEGAHHDHPDFRSNGRVFASLWPDGQTAMVVLAPPQQRALCTSDPAAFRPANGAWGRNGCTLVTLAAATPETVAAALQDALLLAQSQPKGRSRT